MLHELKFRICDMSSGASDALSLLVQSVESQLSDGGMGFHLLRSSFLHHLGMLLDDAQSPSYIFPPGTSPGFSPHDLVALLAFCCFFVSAISFQILVGQGMVVMMNFLMFSEFSGYQLNTGHFAASGF